MPPGDPLPYDQNPKQEAELSQNGAPETLGLLRNFVGGDAFDDSALWFNVRHTDSTGSQYRAGLYFLFMDDDLRCDSHLCRQLPAKSLATKNGQTPTSFSLSLPHTAALRQ